MEPVILTAEQKAFYLAWAKSELEKRGNAYVGCQHEHLTVVTLDAVVAFDGAVAAFLRECGYDAGTGSDGFDVWAYPKTA